MALAFIHLKVFGSASATLLMTASQKKASFETFFVCLVYFFHILF